MVSKGTCVNGQQGYVRGHAGVVALAVIKSAWVVVYQGLCVRVGICCVVHHLYDQIFNLVHQYTPALSHEYIHPYASTTEDEQAMRLRSWATTALCRFSDF